MLIYSFYFHIENKNNRNMGKGFIPTLQGNIHEDICVVIATVCKAIPFQ